MNKTKRGILYGMVLGDGGLYILKNQSKSTARLVIGHGINQKEYLEFKNQKLHEIFGGQQAKINQYNSFNKTVQKEYTNVQLCKTHKYFRQMHRVLYQTGKKKFTKQVLDYLTDEGLTYWFLDDGSSSRNYNTNIKGEKIFANSCRFSIATYCSKHEALIIQKWFKVKYNIDVVFDIDKRNGLYSIRSNTNGAIKFVQIISSYVPQSMRYKITGIEELIQERGAPYLIEGDDIV